MTWQPSKDGERLIGRIVLNKRMKDGTVPADTGALLGLKVRLLFLKRSTCFWNQLECLAHELCPPQVVGGKMTESGRLCAFITKVKRGSLADTVGHLRPGKLLEDFCDFICGFVNLLSIFMLQTDFLMWHMDV